MRVLTNKRGRQGVAAACCFIAVTALAGGVINASSSAEPSTERTKATFGLVEKLKAQTPKESRLTRLIAQSQERGQPDALLTAGPVRTTVISSSDVAVDIATDGRDLCYGESALGSISCARVADFDPNLVSFATSGGPGTTRVLAVAPDGISKVSATGANGDTNTSAVVDNIAVVQLAGDQAVKSVSWKLRDGSMRTQTTGAAR